MKKSVSLLISLCLAVTSAAAAITPAASSADDSRKGFSISTYRDSDSIYAALGNTVTIPTSYVNEGDVVIPCALYYTEQTNDTQTISVQLTINSEDGDPKSPTFTLYSPTASYFAEAKTFSTALGDATTNKYVSFAGKLTKRGTFSPSGTTFPVCEEKMLSASTTNYYIGYSWFCVDGYNWAGYTSDQYPLFVFDVTFPQGTASGTYTIDYCNYNTNQSGSTINPSCLVEYAGGRYSNYPGCQSNLDLNTMKIVISDDAPDITTATTTTTTTTTETTTTTDTATTTATESTTTEPVSSTTAETTETTVSTEAATTTLESTTATETTASAETTTTTSEITTTENSTTETTSTTSVTTTDLEESTTTSTQSSTTTETTSETTTTSTVSATTSDTETTTTSTETVSTTTESTTTTTESTTTTTTTTTTTPPAIVPGSLTMTVGDTVKLTVSGIDDTASIIWISGNSNTVTVSDGEVTAIGVGKAVVYAIQGSNVLTCNIEVEPLKVTIYGDANFDDKLDISDAVMILQAIANPQKYGTNGYDQNHLTLQGEVNSDCYRPGTGMTSMDALAIQKSVLGLVTLPQES